MKYKPLKRKEIEKLNKKMAKAIKKGMDEATIEMQHERIKELEAINEEHRKINGKLRKTINEAIEYNKKVMTWYTNEEITDEIAQHNLNILQGSEDK